MYVYTNMYAFLFFPHQIFCCGVAVKQNSKISTRFKAKILKEK